MIDLSKHFFILNEKIQYLRQDFIGLTFNFSSVVSFAEELFIAVLLLLLMFLFGNKINEKIFHIKSDKHENVFSDIAFGYIFIGTGIALLGIFSTLNLITLIIFLFVICLISIYSFSTTKKNVRGIIFILSKILNSIKKSRLNLAVFGFVFISFLRLMLPETGVDALWYHTDYPREYLKHQSLMIEPKGSLYVAATPQLAQMFYVVNEAMGLRDASRMLHFLFYILVVLLLYYIGSSNKFKAMGIYAPLLFVTAPVIIRHTSTAYVDFQWIFLWLLAFWFIIKEDKLYKKNIILSALLFGGVLATKIQALPFFSPFLLIIFFKFKNKILGFKYIFLFIVLSVLIPLIWYLRAYVLTGNPFYPISIGNEANNLLNFLNYLSLDSVLLRIKNFSSILTISILSFICIGYLMLIRRIVLIKFFKSNVFIFTIILFTEYFFLPSIYLLARHLIYLYSISILSLSVGIYAFVSRYKLIRYLIPTISFLLFFYYLFTTFILLPYGFGWADKNKYLTRVLEWDNSSYYDFDRQFSSHIKVTDLIATYGVQGFYYADFNHIDVDYFFSDKDKRNLSVLSKNGVTKLITKRGNINWFCKEWKIVDCSPNKYKLISKHSFTQQYLYSLTRTD